MDEAGVQAAVEFFTTAIGLHEGKSRCPADDVMTVWTRAQVDGEPLYRLRSAHFEFGA